MFINKCIKLPDLGLSISGCLSTGGLRVYATTYLCSPVLISRRGGGGAALALDCERPCIPCWSWSKGGGGFEDGSPGGGDPERLLLLAAKAPTASNITQMANRTAPPAAHDNGKVPKLEPPSENKRFKLI